ncbi:MAG: HEAT repeat domain-containing protein, partial [Thermoguttaceae bacterium]
LQWRLDAQLVDRARVNWLCDQMLCAADYKVERPTGSPSIAAVATAPETTVANAPQPPGDDPTVLRELEIPNLPRVAEPRRRFGSQVDVGLTPCLVPLPGDDETPRPDDLADAWAMQGHRLGEVRPGHAALELYPAVPQSLPAPAIAEVRDRDLQTHSPWSELSPSECMRRLHAAGLESLSAEAELKRRGFDALRLSIARRVYDPDPKVRLELVRELPGIPGIGAAEWLLKMAADEHEDVRLAAISLLATLNDPVVLDQIESIARLDSSERVRQQALRLKQRRQDLQR